MIKEVVTRLRGNTLQIKNLSWYLVASLLSSVIAVIFNPFLAKNLSPVDYSTIGFYTSFSGLFTPIINFSLISYYVRKYFKIPEENRQKVCDTVLTALMVWGIVAEILILGGFYTYHTIKQIEFPFAPFAYITVTQLFFNSFALIYQVNCRMQRKAKSYFGIVMTGALITLVLSIVFVIIIKGGAVGRLSSGLISAIIVGFYAIKKTIRHPHIDYHILKEAVSFGWPISLAGIIEYFLKGVAVAMVATIGDTETMALFVVGGTLSNYLSIFYSALIQTFEPDIYKAVADFDYRKIIKIVIGILSILLFIILVFCLFARPVTAILTYDRYTDACFYARILSFSVMTTFLMSITKMIINAFGYTKAVLLNQIVSAACAYCMYLLLINHFQFIGAAIGQVMAPMLVFIIGLIQMRFLVPKIKKQEYNEKQNKI